ncbi:CocE/NonD family hydrolase C-terminal non-catalytic domain-containing protein [Tunicatimonas pelagia]|uniref:CocE/NonD family hydrolase C-terminal non-catalytic domain-containing protein n=1 Tax=Tunicatimonas pelagia TaxID=931531 RepID=UPI002665431A|nr:CocE/NonD family hydrolase C-terminal non-catalytic domain-containing protein [Tunicatimonas pelagia]WKN42991.1 CocE/NonD family hydrolase C-terminal non-catalytic domain-containing protein [Tunicatimonas pelagia]
MAESGKAGYDFSDRPPRPLTRLPPLGTDFSSGWQAWDRVEKNVLTYRSDPLSTAAELIGEMELTVSMQVSTVDVDVVVILSEEFPNGDVSYVMRTALRASQRALYTAATEQAGRLIYPFTHSKPLVPNQMYQLRIGFPPVAHRLSEGFRLRLDLVPIWVATLHLGWDFSPLPYAGKVTIVSGGEEPSRLSVPYLPVAAGTPSAIHCQDRPNQPCRVSE